MSLINSSLGSRFWTSWIEDTKNKTNSVRIEKNWFQLQALFHEGAQLEPVFCFKRDYGRKPMPPSKVMVSPFMYFKSGDTRATQARPMSSSGSPK